MSGTSIYTNFAILYYVFIFRKKLLQDLVTVCYHYLFLLIFKILKENVFPNDSELYEEIIP